MYNIENKTKEILNGCIIKSKSGINLYTPDGKGFYPALWTRDFAYMVEYGRDLIRPEDIKNCIDYLIDGARETDGWIPDRVDNNGEIWYTAGGRDFPALPNLDNGQFLVIAANSYLDMLERDDAEKQFKIWEKSLARGINCLPVNKECMIENNTEPLHSPYGFTDCIKKSGLLSLETLLLWRALKYMAKWCALCGLENEEYESKAKQIEDVFSKIFSDSSGMLYSATETGRKIDIWASCYALSIDFPLSDDQKKKIADWLFENKESYISCGQIRHLHKKEYWDETFIEVDKETYQNGAYWAVASGWAFDALKKYYPEVAVEIISDVLEYFEKEGIYECVNNDYKKLDSYVVSAVNVYGVYDEYMQLKGLLDRE